MNKEILIDSVKTLYMELIDKYRNYIQNTILKNGVY